MAIVAATLLALLTVAKPAQAAFPGSNGAIAFTSDTDDDLDIYRMRADGANPFNLTNDNAHLELHASWQPN